MAQGLTPLRDPPVEEDLRINAAFREFCRERDVHGVLISRERNVGQLSQGLSVLLARRLPAHELSMVCAHLELYLETWLTMMLCEAETRKHYAIRA